MDKERRKFLKIAGATALAGVGAPVVAKLTATSAMASEKAHGTAAEAHGDQGTAHGEEQAGGIRYGMVVDMRKLYGNTELMDKAIAACGKAHNIPQYEDKKNEIKWIWKTPFENAFPEHSGYHMSKTRKESDFLVLCNHCDSPPCVRVCPTKATFRLDNGVVAMDYHRCIGCRFCMMGCPYGARSFNWFDPRDHIKDYTNPDFPTRTRGVVEKCNFCSERLALGLKPACVEAVGDSGALVFGNLNDPDSEIRKVLEKENTIQRKPSLGTKPSIFYIV